MGDSRGATEPVARAARYALLCVPATTGQFTEPHGYQDRISGLTDGLLIMGLRGRGPYYP